MMKNIKNYGVEIFVKSDPEQATVIDYSGIDFIGCTPNEISKIARYVFKKNMKSLNPWLMEHVKNELQYIRKWHKMATKYNETEVDIDATDKYGRHCIFGTWEYNEEEKEWVLK